MKSTAASRQIQRRDFLKLMGLTAGGAILAACAPNVTPAPPTAAPTAVPPTAVPPTAAPTAAPPTAVPPTVVPPTAAPTVAPTSAVPTGKSLKMWWWGETEAPGVEQWLKASIDQYQKASGNTIATTLQDVNSVITDFQTASAAKNAPDIQFLWNGSYHMESVWLGYVEPLDDLIPSDILLNTNATALSVYQGKHYRMGWYSEAPLWLYNKDMFDKAGLNADTPPLTFEDLLSACDKLKSKGILPITAGLQDGQWGDWYLTQSLAPNLDAVGDTLALFIGSLDWKNPRYYDSWTKLAKLWKAGYFNNDMNSIALYPGVDLFSAGKGAMTGAVVPLVGSIVSKLGAKSVGVMVYPASGQGKLNGKPIIDSAGLGISSQSQNKVVAADFLKFLHSQERVTALWNEVKAMPTDKSFDGTTIDDPLWKQIWQQWIHNNDVVPYIGGLMPGQFWTDGMFVNSQKIVADEYTGEQAGANAAAVAKKWREQNPDMVDRYKIWAKDLGYRSEEFACQP